MNAAANIWAKCLGDIPYMMPDVMLPLMDCPNCKHRNVKVRHGDGHCYMFREKPLGDRCGQYSAARPAPHPCPTCGGMVEMPCRLCAVRERKIRRAAGKTH